VDGVVYGTPVSFTWEPGTTHDVEIAPIFPVGSDRSQRTFQKWNDGTDPVRQIVAGKEAVTYTATYGLQYALFPATVGSGRVELAPASSTYYYDRNSTVELIATPEEGNHFVGWGMDIGGNQNPKPVLIRESLLPIAFFGSTTAVSNFAVMNAARQRPNHEITGNSIFAKISPGELVTINSPGVGPDAPEDATPDANGVIGTRLAGIRVLVGTVAVPVLSVARGRVTAFIPYGAAVLVTRSTSVQVEQDGAALRPGAVAMVAANPAIYTADGTGSGQAKVANEDGSENSPDSPARKGSVISFLATGLGVTEPAGLDREVSANLGPAPKGELEVRVGGAVAEVISAGITPGTLGTHRFEVRVPENARSGSASPLILTVDGAPSQFDVTLAVE
jgi:uncharacterized protein (TIGR03437 family)